MGGEIYIKTPGRGRLFGPEKLRMQKKKDFIAALKILGK